MPATDAQRKADRKYKSTLKRALVTFYPAEAGLWEWLDSQPNKQGYVKQLIREDMERRQNQ